MKTAEFGQPCKAPEPGKCRICGRGPSPGQLPDDPRVPSVEEVAAYGSPTHWTDATRTLCDAPKCVEAARAELTTHPDEAEMLRQPYRGERYGFAPRR